MMFKELDIVKLTHNITEYGLKEGETGAIVNVYNDGEAYEVEFVASDGRTTALLTLMPNDISSLKDNPFQTWNVYPDVYPTNNSYTAGTELFPYNYL